MVRRFGVIAAVVVGLIGLGTSGVQAIPNPFDGTPDQTNLDEPIDGFANWAVMEGGVARRPYVTALSVINGNSVTQVITNGTPVAETNVPAGRIAVAISPTNLCRPGQTAGQGICYSTPNRIGITIGYQIQSGQLGYNFASPAVPLLTPVNADTEFDLTLNLNSLGRTLRWTWANGVPTYWNTTNLGQDDATLRIRLKPAVMPIVMSGSQQVGCSAIPVMECEYTQNTHEVLGASLGLSLDATLDGVFTGALFASTRAYMGSLMASPGETPQMTYGLSAPRTWLDGSVNTSSMYGVLSDATILNFYGATADTVATDAFRASALNVSRIDGGTQGPVTWTRWTAAQQGTNGWLVSIPEIQFALTTSSSSVGKAAAAKVAPARLRVKTKVQSSFNARATGASTLISLNTRSTTCAKVACRVVVSTISSKTSATAKRVATVALPRRSSTVRVSARVKARKGQRLAVVVQAKKGSKWVYVTSALATSK